MQQTLNHSLVLCSCFTFKAMVINFRWLSVTSFFKNLLLSHAAYFSSSEANSVPFKGMLTFKPQLRSACQRIDFPLGCTHCLTHTPMETIHLSHFLLLNGWRDCPVFKHKDSGMSTIRYAVLKVNLSLSTFIISRTIFARDCKHNHWPLQLGFLHN